MGGAHAPEAQVLDDESPLPARDGRNRLRHREAPGMERAVAVCSGVAMALRVGARRPQACSPCVSRLSQAVLPKDPLATNCQCLVEHLLPLSCASPPWRSEPTADLVGDAAVVAERALRAEVEP